MRAFHLVGGFGAMAAVLVACSGDDAVTTFPDAGNDAGSGADVGPDVAAPPGCDLSKDVKDSVACIDDGIGIFVDGASGDDATGSGTKAKPYKTLAKAVKNAGAKLRVYVCGGTYAEDVSLDVTNAVGLFGGLACQTWAYDGTKAIVGVGLNALKIDSVGKPVVVSDLAFVSAAGVAAGDSSVAAFVKNSANVLFRRVRLTAGAGKAGAAGATGSNWTAVAQSDPAIAGNNASGTTGGGTHSCNTCVDAVTTAGAAGGGGGLTPGAGGNGLPNLSANPPTDGAGGNPGCVAGHNGASAAVGGNGAGATASGDLVAEGWKVSRGTDAKNGGPGQGGGGGGGGTALNGGGGGGGACGGCGGAAGKSGGSGGSSLALASLGSAVTLAECQLQAGAGGAGGDGSAGQVGQPGGFSGVAVSPGCAGGNGGTGGGGGAGGGGAGGGSIGVLYKGTAPALDATTTSQTTVAAAAAAKGKGGAPGVNDGVDGAFAAMLELK
jgi:hypothetical protein